MSLEHYWDDYEVGERFTTLGRTLTNADIRMFIGATDASHPAHVDAEYCKRHPFGKMTVPGALTIGVVDGIVVRYLVPAGLKLAHYGYDKIRFLKPVYPGDTLSLRAEVIGKREKNDEFGLVFFRYDVLNQDGDVVMVVDDVQMVERRSAGPSLPNAM
jgi:acyl dehydratase